MSRKTLVVIGAGVTGSAIARDAAMRGIDTVVIESGLVGSGTSGRFHSMLQSGARYVVTDTAYAAECMRERRILEHIAPFARVDTQGLFVTFEDDDDAFADRFDASCELANIPVTRISAQQVAEREPKIAKTRGGFVVPDAVFHPWQIVPAIAASAVAHGAQFLTNTTVTEILSDGAHATGVRVRDAEGASWVIHCDGVVIAAGVWSPALGAHVGLEIEVETSKGAMLVVPGENVNAVVNRCRPPQSFDIAVPLNGSTVFGTTSSIVDNFDDIEVTSDEFEQLCDEYLFFNPSARSEERSGWRAYAGVRPLVSAAPGEGGAVSRKHAVFNGSTSNAFAVVGGSFTTHRAMAEDVTNKVAAVLGVESESRTAFEALAPSTSMPWSTAAPMQQRGIALGV